MYQRIAQGVVALLAAAAGVELGEILDADGDVGHGFTRARRPQLELRGVVLCSIETRPAVAAHPIEDAS